MKYWEQFSGRPLIRYKRYKEERRRKMASIHVDVVSDVAPAVYGMVLEMMFKDMTKGARDVKGEFFFTGPHGVARYLIVKREYALERVDAILRMVKDEYVERWIKETSDRGRAIAYGKALSKAGFEAWHEMKGRTELTSVARKLREVIGTRAIKEVQRRYVVLPVARFIPEWNETWTMGFGLNVLHTWLLNQASVNHEDLILLYDMSFDIRASMHRVNMIYHSYFENDRTLKELAGVYSVNMVHEDLSGDGSIVDAIIYCEGQVNLGRNLNGSNEGTTIEVLVVTIENLRSLIGRMVELNDIQVGLNPESLYSVGKVIVSRRF